MENPVTSFYCKLKLSFFFYVKSFKNENDRAFLDTDIPKVDILNLKVS